MSKPQLFLIHFAGGNSYSFQFLKPCLPDFEFIPLELPGRGKRMNERLLRDFSTAAADIHGQIIQQLRSDRFLLYGHSMGAVIALKVTALLEKSGVSPLQLIVSGNPGPGVKEPKKRFLLENEAFKEELKAIGGMPDEVLQHKELFEFFEPILKADFEALEKNELSFSPVKAPVYAVMGSEEDCVDRIDNWKQFTLSDFGYTVMPGNHFFIYDHAPQLAAIIKQCYHNFFYKLQTKN